MTVSVTALLPKLCSPDLQQALFLKGPAYKQFLAFQDELWRTVL